MFLLTIFSLQDTLNYSTDSCVLREGSFSMADMSRCLLVFFSSSVICLLKMSLNSKLSNIFIFFLLLLFNSDDDVLQWLASQVDASKDFKICITRDNLFQRGLSQWQRQKKGSPVNKLNVTFIGEAGIDTGALSKEFLTGNVYLGQSLAPNTTEIRFIGAVFRNLLNCVFCH